MVGASSLKPQYRFASQCSSRKLSRRSAEAVTLKRKADSLSPWEFGTRFQHMCISQNLKKSRPKAESIAHYQSQVACIARKTRKLLR